VGSLRLIGAWNEMHSNSNPPLSQFSRVLSFTKAKAAAKQPGSRKSRHRRHHRPPRKQNFPMRFLQASIKLAALKSPFRQDKDRFQNVA
jgi:hypothetical protein